jgi:hypothetical protein
MTGRLRLVRDLVLRPSGIAGLVVAIGGLAGSASLVITWHEARAELAMLGTSQDRAITTVAGWQLPWGVAAAVAGLVALVLGSALAIDRHPGWTRPVTLVAGSVVLACGASSFLRRPTLGWFPDRRGALSELRSVTDALPVGVELSLTVHLGSGPYVAAGGALMILVGVLAARELDRR